MERVSAARMAAAKPQGWVHASLGVDSLKPFIANMFIEYRRVTV